MNKKCQFYLVTLFLVSLAFLSGIAAGTENPHTLSTSGFTDVTVSEAKLMIESGEVFLLDVRTQEEFDAGHIEGATLIPVQELGLRIEEVPQDTKVLVYCRSGKRSVTASNILVDAGYTDVYNMLGGINVWISEGYPVEVTFNPMVYDTNSNGMIEKSEAISSIIDYFEDRITKDEVIAVIMEYFKY